MIGSEELIKALEDAYQKTPILPTLETTENGNHSYQERG